MADPTSVAGAAASQGAGGLPQFDVAQWPGQMMPPLGPVEALPREPAPGRFQRCHVQAHRAEPFHTGLRHVELLVRRGNNQRALLQRLRYSSSETAGEMVIGASRELQFLGFPAARHLAHDERSEAVWEALA